MFYFVLDQYLTLLRGCIPRNENLWFNIGRLLSSSREEQHMTVIMCSNMCIGPNNSEICTSQVPVSTWIVLFNSKQFGNSEGIFLWLQFYFCEVLLDNFKVPIQHTAITTVCHVGFISIQCVTTDCSSNVKPIIKLHYIFFFFHHKLKVSYNSNNL